MSEDQSAGASYLAALRQITGSAGAEPARAPEGQSDDAAALGPRTGVSEKRRSPRYRCQGSAHLREIRSGVATWATFTDISMHGCYVEAMSTFRVGAELQLTIEVNGYRVECRGEVRVVYPGLGMGISFTASSEENRERLTELVRSLAQPSVILGTRIGSDRRSVPASETTSPVTDPVAALQAITDFFRERHMLGREEFLRILQRSKR